MRVIVPSVAVTTTDLVPLGVVINVGTESVAVAGNEFTELGVIEQVIPDGQPEATARATVPLYPPEAANESVYVAVPPAPALCEVGEALIEKSGPTYGVTVRLTSAVRVFVPSDADTVNVEVPVNPLVEVAMEKVTLAGNELTDVEGDPSNAQVAPVGQGVLGERTSVTVPPYPVSAVKESVYEAVLPALTLCEAGEALIEKVGPVE